MHIIIIIVIIIDIISSPNQLFLSNYYKINILLFIYFSSAICSFLFITCLVLNVFVQCVRTRLGGTYVHTAIVFFTFPFILLFSSLSYFLCSVFALFINLNFMSHFSRSFFLNQLNYFHFITIIDMLPSFIRYLQFVFISFLYF
jgi:hypothetical protein